MDNRKVILYFNELGMIKYELYYTAEETLGNLSSAVSLLHNKNYRTLWVDYTKGGRTPYSYEDLMEGKTHMDPAITQDRYFVVNSDLDAVPDDWWKEACDGTFTGERLLALNVSGNKKALLEKMGWEKFFETVPLEAIDTYVNPGYESVDLCLYKNSSLDVAVAFLRSSSGELIQVEVGSKSAEDTLKAVIKAQAKAKEEELV